MSTRATFYFVQIGFISTVTRNILITALRKLIPLGQLKIINAANINCNDDLFVGVKIEKNGNDDYLNKKLEKFLLS